MKKHQKTSTDDADLVLAGFTPGEIRALYLLQEPMMKAFMAAAEDMTEDVRHLALAIMQTIATASALRGRSEERPVYTQNQLARKCGISKSGTVLSMHGPAP